ncbi:MAG: hypothetical protein HYZ27_02775 [Deltaproteobacteria bacterium]|nr:hypothetical protein [Deltaproteobacteria bacterium]
MSKPDPAETRRHAEEIRGQAKGRDTVESRARAQDAAEREGKPAAFDGEDLLVVRSWLKRRPLETAPAAAALIQYPRMWTTKRGRYCKFKAPGAGVYGLLRARPTF